MTGVTEPAAEVSRRTTLVKDSTTVRLEVGVDLPVRYGVRGQSMCMGAKWQGRAGDQTHSTDAYSADKTTLTPHAGVLVLAYMHSMEDPQLPLIFVTPDCSLSLRKASFHLSIPQSLSAFPAAVLSPTCLTLSLPQWRVTNYPHCRFSVDKDFYLLLFC